MMISEPIELTLRQEQEIQLRILRYFDKICKENKIQYFLFAGSLLGAVREKNLIPWDDDIDVCIKSEDIDRFLQAFTSHRNEFLFLQTFETDKYYFVPSVMRLCLKDTDKWGSEYRAAKFNKGLYFDVFILSYGSENTEDDLKIKKAARRLASLGYFKYRALEKPNLKQLVKKIVCRNFLINAARKRYISYIRNRKLDKNTRCVFISDYIGMSRLTYSAEAFEHPEYIRFGEEEYPCPCKYDEVLGTLFDKDYMTPKDTKNGYHKATVIRKSAFDDNPFLQGLVD